MKVCTRCLVSKPLEEFGRNTSAKDNHQSRCRVCMTEVARERYRSDPASRASRQAAQRRWECRNQDRHRADQHRRQLRRRYGITPEDVQMMREAQSGKCLICAGILADLGTHIDHDHETGRVRGLLCPKCNKGLGHFQDDPNLLRSAVRHLGT